jgi:NAD(P)-dependent dehydrogenase (short-subunit alcohol dehydrogenase family)
VLDAAPDVDVVLHNAGIYPLKPLLEMTDEDWHETIEVNLGAIFRLTRRAAARMVEAGRRGAVVNISSVEAFAPGLAHAHYSTAKAGLEMFTRAAAQELGPHGIRVNAVAPGLIDYPELAQVWPEGVARWKVKCPLGRVGRRDEVADACLFLASPAASFITGTTLVVDGGILATAPF